MELGSEKWELGRPLTAFVETCNAGTRLLLQHRMDIHDIERTETVQICIVDFEMMFLRFVM